MIEKIWIDHPESDCHFVGTRDDLEKDGNLLEVGLAITETENEYQDLKYKNKMKKQQGLFI